ncbi:MAG TPA: gamma-glutamyl-gamma-aminobutyrate hydrolase family protein [Tepidisphaeraceae bacterium]|nr:gamma-glutamyl-gamma-aminobutyrate hydrolase family protein [Tepidisphaeraceae bacterium]
MRLPVIGITIDTSEREGYYESPMAYATSVERAGGLPLLIPYRSDIALVSHYVDLCAGILFTGGDDLDPTAFGQSRHPKAVPVDPARETFERALLAEVERRRMPALGICMGSQLMNVHRGGTLIQFLPDQASPDSIEHRNLESKLTRHPVHVDLTTHLGRAIGKEDISVTTSHKQAAGKIGRGLRVIATAPDGVIEGFEDPTFPLFAGVQWHPEKISEEPEHLAPFKLLVEIAARESARQTYPSVKI